METIPCPGCRTPLGPEATSCPICLRPRGKHEIVRAYAQLREDAARRRKRPFVVAAWLLAVGGAGYATWLYRAPLLSAAAAARARVAHFADESMDARNLVAQKPAAAAPAGTDAGPAPTLAPETPVALPKVSTTAATSAPSTNPAPGRPAVAPAARRLGEVRLEDMHVAVPNPSQWILYGRAYDLLSLQPASGVQLMFQSSEGNVVATAATDDEGRYAAVLPRTQGSLAAMSADPRYAPVVLCESDIPYKTLPADERRSLVHSAQDGDARPAELSDSATDESARRDMFLAPRR